MSNQEASCAHVLLQYLQERGAGHIFYATEVPHDTLGIKENTVSPALHKFTLELRVVRERVREPGEQPRYKYTVTDLVHAPRAHRSRPVPYTQPNRKNGGAKVPPLQIVPEVPTEVVVDRLLDNIGELQRRAAKPLSSYTDAQLITELNRRHNTVGVAAMG